MDDFLEVAQKHGMLDLGKLELCRYEMSVCAGKWGFGIWDGRLKEHVVCVTLCLCLTRHWYLDPFVA